MPPHINKAASRLKRQESKALGSKNSQNLRNLEHTSENNPLTENVNFIYTGTGDGNRQSKSSKSRLRAKAPLITAILITILLGGGSLILAIQAIMPTSLAMRIIEEYDIAWVANHSRAKMVTKYAVKTNKLSDKMKHDFETAGIKVDTKNQTFTYTDGNNNSRTTSVDEAFDDAIFVDKFTTATESTAGHYSTAYDAITAKVLKRLDINRDVFTDWDNTKDNVDENAKIEEIKKTIKERSPELHGQTIAEGESEQRSEDSSISKKSTREQIKKHLSLVTGGLGINAGNKCAKFAVSTALTAHTMKAQTSTSYPLLSILEAIQKASQAEAGNYSPINQILNLLTTPDKNGKTAMDAQEVQRIYGNTVAANSNYNIEKLTSQAKNTVDDLHACTTATTIASGAGILVSVATAGTSSFVKIGTGIIGGALVTIGVQEWIDQYIDDATNTIDEQYTALDELTGPAVGAGIVNGANSELNAWARAGGSSYMSAEKLASYNKVKQATIADQAAYERAHLSPFDTSSQYTFLGSLLYNNLIPLAVANHSSSFIGIVTQTSSLLSSSITNILPSASAFAETSVDSELGSCPWLASVNAVGNSDCLPHGGTDPDTLNEDIEAVIKHIIAIGGQFESDKLTLTPTIKSGSNLEKQLKICGTMIDHPGMYSGATAEYLHNETASDSIIDWFASNSIASQTAAGDIAQLIQIANDSTQEGWVNGGHCVASDSEYWQTEGKWYQRFLEDQRLMANFEIIKKSAGEDIIDSA